jgi:hypothetical protein
MALQLPTNDTYVLLLWAAIITFIAVLVGWWFKKKVMRR